MITLIAVAVGIPLFFGSVSRMATGSWWPLPRRRLSWGPIWPITQGRQPERPDYEKINRMELELGLAPSNYRNQGVDSIGLLEADADRRLKEAEQASEDIADQLEPERVIKREIAAVCATPAHVLGSASKTADEIAAELEHAVLGNIGGTFSENMRKFCHTVAKNIAYAEVRGRSIAEAQRNNFSTAIRTDGTDEHWDVGVIQPMDEPYPVTIVTPGIPRLSSAAKLEKIERIRKQL